MNMLRGAQRASGWTTEEKMNKTTPKDGRITRRAVLAVYFGFATAWLSAAVAAAPPAAVALTSQDNADLQRIAAYLGSIRTMYAKFRQVASGGGIATGQLWMARPGRMRFEYDPPNQILLLADMFYV